MVQFLAMVPRGGDMQMKGYLFALMLSIVSVSAFSQSVMYVNKDTLPLREHPDYNSRISLLLHAPTKIMVNEVKGDTEEARELAKDWAQVKFFMSDGTWSGGTTYYGYVLKKHLVPGLSMLTADVDTTLLLSVTIPPSDTTFARQPEINFRETSTGECYYINGYAKREYVDDGFCRRDDEEEMREELEQQE